MRLNKILFLLKLKLNLNIMNIYELERIIKLEKLKK